MSAVWILVFLMPADVSRSFIIPLPMPDGARLCNTSGCDRACTPVIRDNDTLWGDLALHHLERRRDGTIGKQPFSPAQRQRIDLEPERINQIMLDERLKEISTAVHVQIRPWLLLKVADLFRDVSA